MIKPLAVTLCAILLTGCASMPRGKAPNCSGYEQRPLNKSMWDWQNNQPVNGSQYVPPPADPKNPQMGAIEKQSRTAKIDSAASYKACGVA